MKGGGIAAQTKGAPRRAPDGLLHLSVDDPQWDTLHAKFLETDLSVSTFLRENGVSPRSGNTWSVVAGWAAERDKLWTESHNEAYAKIKRERVKAIMAMDSALTTIAPAAISAMSRYIVETQKMTPGEAKVYMDMLLVREGLPTSISKQQVDDQTSTSFEEKLKEHGLLPDDPDGNQDAEVEAGSPADTEPRG